MIINKIEWHQVSYHYETELTADMLMQIYPELEPEEAKEFLQDIADGKIDLDQVIEDSFGECDIDWELDYTDNWTDRKGGYDVTYEIKL
jgi:hypothetical protein